MRKDLGKGKATYDSLAECFLAKCLHENIVDGDEASKGGEAVPELSADEFADVGDAGLVADDGVAHVNTADGDDASNGGEAVSDLIADDVADVGDAGIAVDDGVAHVGETGASSKKRKLSSGKKWKKRRGALCVQSLVPIHIPSCHAVMEYCQTVSDNDQIPYVPDIGQAARANF